MVPTHSPDNNLSDAIVVGGGPAGLRAAEMLAEGGARVAVYEWKPSVGRKFLVAGRGGLNLTHSEAFDGFVARYGEELPRWRELLTAFGPGELRDWAAGLEVETYVGTSGRVFPHGQQAATLLRRWVARLRAAGVTFHASHRLERISSSTNGNGRREVEFQSTRDRASVTVEASALVLALGGASWPQTGSDGTWPHVLKTAASGLQITPWQPANCGWNVAWEPRVLAAAEGMPLKNIAVSVGARTVRGEALITRHGMEGGAIYQLGRELRAMGTAARLEIDFKPDVTKERLLAKLTHPSLGLEEAARAMRLSSAAKALLQYRGPARTPPANPHALVELIKHYPLHLLGPRPIDEAISSAGGIAWSEVDETLMLRRLPGVFVAGEMIDWEAPTGGYLLQGCFATGTRAGKSALQWLGDDSLRDQRT